MTSRDRLRELLDAVLADDNARLPDMAADAFASPYHFSRQLGRHAGEAPVALRRRVLLERAGWRIATGGSVTDAAFEAGYASVEGFARAYARAYGHPPSATTSGTATWLPAPNGIHFHPPMHLWVSDEAGAAVPEVVALQVHHDVADTTYLLERAAELDDASYRRTVLPGHRVHGWGDPEESVADLLRHLVGAREVWTASIAGHDQPPPLPDHLADRDDDDGLVARHAVAGPAWIACLGDIGRRGAWGDRLVDALCDPPESFVLASVVAHVLTYTAYRRQLLRHLLRTHGVVVDEGDPIAWLSERHQPADPADPAPDPHPKDPS